MAGMLIFYLSYLHGSAQQPLHASTDVPGQGRLDNQMAYFVQKNTHPSEQTLLYLVVKTGAIHESDQESGYAHFLEHMAFKGGKRFVKKSFVQYLQEQGLQVGLHYNAQTNYQYTLYTIALPKAASPDIQRQTLAFFADILDGLTLDHHEIETEKKIVLEEKRISGPQEVHALHKLGNSRYKDRWPIGTDKSIRNITKESLNHFYKKWYQPKNAAVFIVGNINPAESIMLIREQFSPIRNNTEKNIAPEDGLYDFLGEEVKHHTVKEREKTRIFLEWGNKHRTEATASVLREKAIEQVFEKLLEKRLENALEKEADYLHMASDHFLADVDYITLSCSTENAPDSLIKKILKEIKRVSLHGVSENELQHYVEKQIKRLNNKKYGPKNATTLIHEYMDHYLGIRSPIITQKKDSTLIQALSHISPDNVKDQAQSLWQSRKLRVFIELPPKKQDSVTLAQILEIRNQINIEKLAPLPFHPIEEHTEKAPSPGSFALHTEGLAPQAPLSQKYLAQLNITHLNYKNGIEVFLKPIQNDTKDIRVLGIAPGGTSALPDSLYRQYESTVPYMELGGVGNLDTEELEQFLDDKDMGISLNISEYQRNVYSYTKNHHAEDFFKYLFLKMTAARTDAKVFREVVEEEIARSGDKTTSHFVTSHFDEKVEELKNNFFPNRRGAETEEEFKRLDLSKMSSFYHKAFGNASGWKFIVSGKFTLDSIRPLVDTYFGDFPYADETVRNRNLFDEDDFPDEITLPAQGHKNTATTCFILYGKHSPSVKGNILASILEQLISARITSTLREQHGLVYTPVVVVEKNMYPAPLLTLQIHYDCKPENIKKAKKAVKEALKKIIKKPISKTEVKSYKKGALLGYRSLITDNSIYNWGFGLLAHISSGDKIGELETFTKILDTISVRELRSYLKNTLDLDRMKVIQQSR